MCDVLANEVPKVPKGHPRVYVQAKDLPGIRAKLTMPQFHEAWQAVRGSNHIWCRAFVYLIEGDRTAGRNAIEKWFAYAQENMDDPNKVGRHFDNLMHLGACVYDWCYDLLTESEKQRTMRLLK